MPRWIDIKKYAVHGNPKPPSQVIKSEEEWRKELTEEAFRVTRLHATERPFSSEICTQFSPGLYACTCCKTLLFDSSTKFDSGTGWPSFSQPVEIEVVSYHQDSSLGMRRIEARCNVCDAHLGHVFPDGPPPTGLRYCINAVALQKVEKKYEKAVFGGGCFWCTEAMFSELDGVSQVESGYSGGQVHQPTYREVCSGKTGHAEVVQVTYDPTKISYADLLRIHLSTHDPTTPHRQGADVGSQYRSIIFFESEMEQKTAKKILKEMQDVYSSPIVTEIVPLKVFYKAEEHHQEYYAKNSSQNNYCRIVIDPKLDNFRKKFGEVLKTK